LEEFSASMTRANVKTQKITF